jgi:hypothetical protein
MKTGCVCILAGTLALTGAASADFTGVSLVEITEFRPTGIPNVDLQFQNLYRNLDIRVWRVALEFDGNDRLLRWGGAPGGDGLAPMIIDVGGPTETLFNREYDPVQEGFYNDLGSIFVPGRMDALFDSWAQLGLDLRPERYGQFADGTITMFDAMDGVHQPIATDAGFIVDPASGDGDALNQLSSGLVPIAQITYDELSDVDVPFSFMWEEIATGEQHNGTVAFHLPALPAPERSHCSASPEWPAVVADDADGGRTAN